MSTIDRTDRPQAEMVRQIVASHNGYRDIEPLPRRSIAGAVQLLDEQFSGWWQEIDLDRLDATHGWDIVGQLYGTHYRAGYDELGLRDDPHATSLGFHAADRTNEGWLRHWATWRAEILTRRDNV